MANAVMSLEIVSAEASLFSGDVTFIAVTGSVGELGIYPGHMPLLTSLKPGYIRAIFPNNEEELFYVSGGMLEVQPNSITVLADTAVRAEELDEAAAKAAQEEAEKKLTEQKAGFEYSKAVVELAEAVAQLRAIQQLRKRVKS